MFSWSPPHGEWLNMGTRTLRDDMRPIYRPRGRASGLRRAGSRRLVSTADIRRGPVVMASRKAILTTPTKQKPAPAAKLRGDIAGLRAIPVGTELPYHNGLPPVPGGHQ